MSRALTSQKWPSQVTRDVQKDSSDVFLYPVLQYDTSLLTTSSSKMKAGSGKKKSGWTQVKASVPFV